MKKRHTKRIFAACKKGAHKRCLNGHVCGCACHAKTRKVLAGDEDLMPPKKPRTRVELTAAQERDEQRIGWLYQELAEVRSTLAWVRQNLQRLNDEKEEQPPLGLDFSDLIAQAKAYEVSREHRDDWQQRWRALALKFARRIDEAGRG